MISSGMMTGANKLSLRVRLSEFRVIAHVAGIKPTKSICFRSMQTEQLGRELSDQKINKLLKVPIRKQLRLWKEIPICKMI